MAPLTLLTTLASILALSASATAQTGTGTGTGLPFSSATMGAPYPISNATLPTGPSSLSGSPIQSGTTCPVPTTVTTTTQVTVTVTVPASSAPYPIPGSSGLPVGTGTGTGYATATGYAKRMEMRGLKQERKVRKPAARFW